MIDRLLDFILNLATPWRKPKTYSLAIVRRYADANGAYVGELYLLGTFAGVLQYSMIGASLDSLPFDARSPNDFTLDLAYDFLGVRHGAKNVGIDKAWFAPMPPNTVRIGAHDPRDNDAVRAHVARLAREGKISLQVQNRFIENVLNKR